MERTSHLRMTYGFILAGLRSKAGPDLLRYIGDGTMTLPEAIAALEKFDPTECAPIAGCTCAKCAGTDDK
jgi:hypothetical protein